MEQIQNIRQVVNNCLEACGGFITKQDAEKIEENLIAIDEKVSDIEDDLQELKWEVRDLENQIEGLEEQEDDIESLRDDLEKATDELEEIKDRVPVENLHDEMKLSIATQLMKNLSLEEMEKILTFSKEQFRKGQPWKEAL